MLEFLLCSLVTLLPIYLFRRYVQDKRFGREITLYSVWFELRWGIIACFTLTVSLITRIFYYHPSTTDVTGFFRTITILPEAGGRVSEVLVTDGQLVAAGAPLFRLEEDGQQFQAGFGQFSAQVIHPGMIGEVTCASLPFTIVSMVVTKVQNVTTAGQFRPSDQLIDVQTSQTPGTTSVSMTPLYDGQAVTVPPGSSCVANVCTSNHHRLETEGLGTLQRVYLHVVDTVGIAHAAPLRIQAMLLPVKTLAFSGGH